MLIVFDTTSKFLQPHLIVPLHSTPPFSGTLKVICEAESCSGGFSYFRRHVFSLKNDGMIMKNTINKYAKISVIISENIKND